MDGRFNVGFTDIKGAAHSALRHRILVNFEGEAEGIKVESVIDTLLESVPTEVATVGIGD